MRRLLALLTAAPLAAMLVIACGDDDTVGPPDGADGGDAAADVTPQIDGGGGKDADAGPVDTEFTTFVKNLITNETRDTNLPTETENKTFTDKEDPAAFPPSFFP